MRPDDSFEVELDKLMQRVQVMRGGSIKPETLDLRAFVKDWLHRTHPALAGQKPAEFMCCAEGRASVESILGSLWSGAYQ